MKQVNICKIEHVYQYFMVETKTKDFEKLTQLILMMLCKDTKF